MPPLLDLTMRYTGDIRELTTDGSRVSDHVAIKLVLSVLNEQLAGVSVRCYSRLGIE